MIPFRVGSHAIAHVSLDGYQLQKPPVCFEPGTAPIASIIGLGEALQYLQPRLSGIIQQEQELMQHVYAQLEKIPMVQVIGTKKKQSILSFNIGSIHAHDVATVLDHEHICVRAGHHCAQPLMKFLQLSSAVRLSFACYNTMDDINQLVQAIYKVIRLFEHA